jgi:hypothetical protein
MPAAKTVTACFTRHTETERQHPKKGAILVSDTGNRKDGIWLAKALITWRRLNGPDLTAIEVSMPHWLAKEKGIVD